MNILTVFRIATKAVGILPEPVGRAAFAVVGTISGWSNLKGVQQLRKNYQRLVPLRSSWAQRRRSARAMRAYMRYYYEVFRLPALTAEQISARVTIEGDERLWEYFNQGTSVSGALLHSGNWDLAGAWTHDNLVPTHTIAEKLEPAELADMFLDFRRKIGLTIYQTGQGNNIRNLTADMESSTCFTPILCDRDLSASGVEAQLGGHAVRVAVGAALLAQRTSTPMFPITIYAKNFKDDAERVRRAGSPWGIHIVVGEGIHPRANRHSPRSEREADLVRMNQEWLDQAFPILIEHLEDWHMLQKVFVADLDQRRLAKNRAAKVNREDTE